MSGIVVTSFYSYVNLPNAGEFRSSHQQFCNELGIKGKILVADEGINGSVSGTKRQISAYKKHLLQSKLFADVKFRDTPADAYPYKRMIVRLRPEIVTFGSKVDLKNAAGHVSPATLKLLIENRQVILLDARNSYESRIGKFKGAITPSIETFRDFPKILPQLQNYRNRKIVAYCTGGIRCEKASAYLKENGFSDVCQLEGGILNFIEKFPDSHFEGRCFVFDSRLSVPSGTKNGAIAACDLCHASCDSYINCRNVKCDRLFICCPDCSSKLSGTCSKKCRNVAENGNNS